MEQSEYEQSKESEDEEELNGSANKTKVTKRKRSKDSKLKKAPASDSELKVENIENNDEESKSIDTKVRNLNESINAYPLPKEFDRSNLQHIDEYFRLNENPKEHKIYRFGIHGSRFVSNNQLKNEDGSFQALVDGQPLIFDSSFKVREWTADKKAKIHGLSELINLWTGDPEAVSAMESVEIEGLSNFSSETKLKLTE